VSDYLKTPGTFEQAVKRGLTSRRSKELDQLVEAVRVYIQMQTPGQILDVKDKFVAWQNKNPKEFFDRGSSLAADFNQEVRAIVAEKGVEWNQFDPDNDSDDDLGVLPGVSMEIPEARAVAPNRWIKLLEGANTARKVADKGLTVLTNAATVGQVANYVGLPGAGVVSAGIATAGVATALAAMGPGAIVAPIALQAVTSALAAKSVHSTDKHLKNLLAIYYARKTPGLKQCGDPPGFERNPAAESRQAFIARLEKDHTMIADHVLPYLIKQKSKKRKRKALVALPILGSAEGLRAVINKANKKRKKTLGKDREDSAKWLSNHFLEFDCKLSQAIIAELFSAPEMEWMKTRQGPELQEFIAGKMKSV